MDVKLDMADSKRELAEKYDNWTMIDLQLCSDSPEIERIVDIIFDDLLTLSDFKKGNPRIRKKHINIVVLNLYKQLLGDHTAYVGYHRSSNRYSEIAPRHNKYKIKRTLITIVDAMVQKGYIENKKGHYGRTGDWSSHIARMRGTKRLYKLFVDCKGKSGPAVIEKAPDAECIILRKSDPEAGKVEVPYDDTPETERMRYELRAYNDLLRMSFIDLQYYPKSGIPTKSGKKNIHIDFSDRFVKRIFNDGSWSKGGRFYGGWWQRLPKEWRAKIHIGYHLPVIEIDYSGLHIVLLYALEGIDYWEIDGKDPYYLDGYESSERMRALLKKVLLRAINAATRTKAYQSVRTEIYDNKDKYGWVDSLGLDLKKLIDDFAKRHSEISHHFFSGSGIKLQYLDSLLAEYIIRKITKMKIPVLCVHDSFIVPSPFEESLRFLMKGAFKFFLEKVDLPI
jgi:hypothetical protein